MRRVDLTLVLTVAVGVVAAAAEEVWVDVIVDGEGGVFIGGKSC